MPEVSGRGVPSYALATASRAGGFGDLQVGTRCGRGYVGGAGALRCVPGQGRQGVRLRGWGPCRTLTSPCSPCWLVRRMQGAGKALHELLLSAQRQGCLTAGVYESAKVLNV